MGKYTTMDFDCMIYGGCGGYPNQFNGEDAVDLLRPFLKGVVHFDVEDESGAIVIGEFKPSIHTTLYGEKIYITLTHADGFTEETDYEFGNWPAVTEAAHYMRSHFLEHIMNEVFFGGERQWDDKEQEDVDTLYRMLNDDDSPLYKYTPWIPEKAVDGFFINALRHAMPRGFLAFFREEEMTEKAEEWMMGIYFL